MRSSHRIARNQTFVPSRAVLVTGAAQAARPRDRARAGARTAGDVAVPLPRLGGRGATSRRRAARRQGARAERVRGRPGRRGQACARWCRRSSRASGRLDCGGQQRVDLRARHALELRLRRDGSPLAHQHRRRRSCWRRRCTRTCCARRQPTAAACVNLLDQKLCNLNPDYLSYTLSKAALQAATSLLAQALAPRCGCAAWRPGVTLPSGPMTQAEFDARRTRMTPLRPLVDARRHRPRRALPAGDARDHRHHAAGRRRPAPVPLSARRHVLVDDLRETPLTCTACHPTRT